MAMSINRFVAREAVGIAAFNAGINTLYTWWLWRSLEPLTLFDEHAIGFDLASTPVWIAGLSTLLGTAAIRGKLRDGRVAMPYRRAPAMLDLLPSGIILRSLLLGALAAVVLAVPVRLILQLSAVETLSLPAAVLMKIAITVPMSLVTVPLVVLAGLADVQRTAGPNQAMPEPLRPGRR